MLERELRFFLSASRVSSEHFWEVALEGVQHLGGAADQPQPREGF